MNDASIVIYTLLLILSTLLVVIGYFGRNYQYRYIMRSRLKRIDGKKFLKIYLLMLGVFLLSSNGNKNFTWLDSIVLSSFISFMIIYHTISRDFNSKEREMYYDEDIKKALDRDKKLNSILKKGLW